MKNFNYSCLLLLVLACNVEGASWTDTSESRTDLTATAYNFGTLASPGKCLDVNGSGSADGTNIQSWTCNGSGAQSFWVQDLGGGSSRLVNTTTAKCVDVNAAGTADGTNIQLWTCNG